MGMTDPIADLLTRIRNALMVKHEQVDLPRSRIKREILEILKQEGFVADYAVLESGMLRVALKYVGGQHSVLRGLKRVSKPGSRVYVKADDLPTPLNGQGIAILSTSKGLLTDQRCRELRLGGEVLCYVW